jgi:hypothetical protein
VVSGEVSVVVLVDPASIRASLHDQGLTLRLVASEERELEITGGPATLRISGQFLGRVAGEFLSLDWFTEEIVARATMGPPREALHLDTLRM